jgi:hypothetical protein
MHIDTTILPLGPGKILINPEYIDVDRLPAILKKWDILVAPEPDPIADRTLKVTSLCGKWLNMNVLTVDEKRVIVDPHHTRTMRAMGAMGIRADSMRVLALRRIWRRLPLRHARHPAARHVGELFLSADLPRDPHRAARPMR